MQIDEVVTRYLEEPSEAGWTRLQREIMAAENYDPLVRLRAGLPRTLSPEAVREAVEQLMPGALLSPLAHGRSAIAHQQLGDPEAAERQRRLSILAIHGIRGRRRGTRGEPFRVLRVDDEYDVLEIAGQRPASQAEVSVGGATYDVITTDNGAEIWFELLWRA